MIKNILITIVIAIPIGLLIGFVWNNYKKEEAKQRMAAAAIHILDSGSTLIPSTLDYYKNICVYKYDVDEEVRVASVISLGKDGKLGTEDDLKIEKKDFNKSRLFGAYAAERGKEIAGGILEGLSRKSKFKEEDAND